MTRFSVHIKAAIEHENIIASSNSEQRRLKNKFWSRILTSRRSNELVFPIDTPIKYQSRLGPSLGEGEL